MSLLIRGCLEHKIENKGRSQELTLYSFEPAMLIHLQVLLEAGPISIKLKEHKSTFEPVLKTY